MKGLDAIRSEGSTLVGQRASVQGPSTPSGRSQRRRPGCQGKRAQGRGCRVPACCSSGHSCQSRVRPAESLRATICSRVRMAGGLQGASARLETTLRALAATRRVRSTCTHNPPVLQCPSVLEGPSPGAEPTSIHPTSASDHRLAGRGTSQGGGSCQLWSRHECAARIAVSRTGMGRRLNLNRHGFSAASL